jgi:carbon-monoxide dehydrogenase medium subunit
VYPPRFDYLAPTSVEEVIEALGERGGDAKVMAGGQSLIPVLKLRIASVGTIVDLNRVEGLDEIGEEGGLLRIGALVRHVQAERSPLLTKRYALLGATARLVADPLVRNRGTVCGSLAHADPQGDWGSALLAARASAVVRGAGGERTVPVEELALGPFMTTLAPDEVITEVRVPDPGPRASGTYLKLERKVGDFATAAVGVQVSLDNGHVGEVGIGLTGVGATNLRAKAAEDSLRGAEPTDDAIREAAELAAQAAEPQADHRGSVDYKRNVVRVFCERGLRTAISAAQAGEEGRS